MASVRFEPPNYWSSEQAVSDRHKKAFIILQSWSTDSSWIQLIHLIQWIWYKIDKNRDYQGFLTGVLQWASVRNFFKHFEACGPISYI